MITSNILWIHFVWHRKNIRIHLLMFASLISHWGATWLPQNQLILACEAGGGKTFSCHRQQQQVKSLKSLVMTHSQQQRAAGSLSCSGCWFDSRPAGWMNSSRGQRSQEKSQTSFHSSLFSQRKHSRQTKHVEKNSMSLVMSLWQAGGSGSGVISRHYLFYEHRNTWEVSWGRLTFTLSYRDQYCHQYDQYCQCQCRLQCARLNQNSSSSGRFRSLRSLWSIINTLW